MKHGVRLRKPEPVALPVLVASPLTPAEQERARAMRNTVHALCPEAVPFIQSLTELGMIHGWRDVAGCRKLDAHERRAV